VHAVPGRLRVRLLDGVPIAALDGLGAVRVAPGVLAVEMRVAARSVVVRYHPAQTSEDDVLVALEQSGIVVVVAETVEQATPDMEQGSGSGVTLRELLIGPPPKLDRRFAESLALSAVSLVGARQIGVALGGGMTLPAYFVIWLTLRRLTGAGRRR
jgi:hypothetical protein